MDLLGMDGGLKDSAGFAARQRQNHALPPRPLGTLVTYYTTCYSQQALLPYGLSHPGKSGRNPWRLGSRQKPVAHTRGGTAIGPSLRANRVHQCRELIAPGFERPGSTLGYLVNSWVEPVPRAPITRGADITSPSRVVALSQPKASFANIAL